MADIAAIGITNQRETTVVWDRATGKAIHNAIVWQDRRTADLCDELRNAGDAPDLEVHRTGAGRLFLRHQSRLDPRPRRGAQERAERGELAFGTVDSFLIWHLTGGAVTRPTPPTPLAPCSTTSTTSLGSGMLDLFGVPASVLPRSKPAVASSATRPPCRRSTRPSPVWPATSKRALRAPMHLTGMVKHIRHRLLHAAEHRHEGRGQ